MTSETQLNVAVIGTGFGERVIVPCLNAIDGVSVKALVSRNPEQTDLWSSEMAKAGDIQFFRSAEEMLDGADVDLVCVAIPPEKHEHAVTACLTAGKHVLCEKPLSHDMQSAARMAEVAKDAKGSAWVDHQLRYHPGLSKVKTLLDDNAVGDVYFVELTYETSTRVSGENPKWHWWFDEAQGGGQLFALGSHMIDLMHWWFGDIEAVQANLLTTHKQRADTDGVMRDVTADESAFLHLQLKDDVPATVMVSSVCADDPMMKMRIVGSQGIIEFDWNGALTLSTSEGGLRTIACEDEYIGQPVIGENVWRTSLIRQVKELLANIRSDAPTSCATFQDALKTQRVMDAAKQSNRNKSQVII